MTTSLQLARRTLHYTFFPLYSLCPLYGLLSSIQASVPSTDPFGALSRPELPWWPTRKRCIYRLFPITWLVVGENSAHLPHIEAPGGLFKLAVYRQILRTPNFCHMDLWLARLVLTHHH